jgi:type IV pilus assembly protein PilY1
MAGSCWRPNLHMDPLCESETVMKNTLPHWLSLMGRPLGQTIGCSLLVWAIGAIASPAMAAVAVEQQPLIIQKPLPPNLVLMFDDSGSMAWDYMPDDPSDTSPDGYRNSTNNGTYYNPNVIYSPPPKADGSSYPDSTDIGNAPGNGFDSSSTKYDVTKYNKGKFNYYELLSAQTPESYDPTLGCKSGDSLSSDGKCAHVTSVTYSYYKPFKSKGTPYCNPGDSLIWRNGSYQCRHATMTYEYYDPNVKTCPKGGSYDSATDKCVATQSDSAYLFTYTTSDGNGYVRHYVGKSEADCAVATANGATCDYDAATQKNVANWFSYYRTRLLMAKSGVMNSFADVSPDFRIGYGSLHGNNNVNLGAEAIKSVAAFGDGSSGTRKADFWAWLESESASGGTPLRSALASVGAYYQTAAPWRTDPTDSESTKLACRQSYTILTTDGFWNSDTDFSIGNVDNNSATLQGTNGQTFTYTPIAPFADEQSNTLADVAMKYWITDLQPDVDNEVPTNAVDKAFWQHMSTFTLSLGFDPVNISPQGTTVDSIFNWIKGGPAIDGFSWPIPSGTANNNDGSVNNIADLAHAAVNSRGGFYSATDPQAFTSGIQDALKRASERVGTGASLAANSTELKTGAMAYQANYFTGSWKGELKALALDPNTGGVAVTPTWTASGALPGATSRNIHSFNTDPDVAKDPSVAYVVFKVVDDKLPSLSTAQLALLGKDETARKAMVNYLRGDATNEQRNNGGFRDRNTPLGDIVNSQPIYVGAPDPNQFYGENFTGITGTKPYSGFASGTTDSAGVFTASAASSRTQLIYVASNDGMLHAFSAEDGKEVYAYLPGAVINANVADLSNPAYGSGNTPHQFYNDGELTVADVYMNSDWHTVLVGTTGRGTAKAVYALDITDPKSDGSGIKVLWERSAGDAAADGNSKYIGQIVGKPVIAQVADGDWAVLVGNGYNSSAGTSALLQFELSDGSLSVHSTTDTSVDNGLAAPVTWMGNSTNDGISTVAYAGDLLGQVWSFALNSNNKSTPTTKGVLLFTAKDSAGKVQPITAGMLVGKKPNTNQLWLFFGTGEYLTQADLSDKSVQTWYGLIVQDTDTPALVTSLSKGRTALLQRFITAETVGSAGDPTASPPVPPSLPARVVSAAGTNSDGTSDMTGKSGWYMDLQTPATDSNGATTYTSKGERMVLPNQFQGSLLLGTTRVPVAADLCNPSGTGWVMAIDPFTGTNPKDSFFDFNGNGVIDDGDMVTIGDKKYPAAGIGFSSLPNSPIFVGANMLMSFDNGTTSSLKTAGTTGLAQRVSWRELVNQ